MEKIRIGIVGYGNIGRGVEQSIKRNDDMELKAVFTRRDPAGVSIQTEGAVVKHFDDMEAMKNEIDVMILCGGSAELLAYGNISVVCLLYPICRSSDQKLLLLSTRSTVSIHTQESRNILQA